jgi:hypothetical protein
MLDGSIVIDPIYELCIEEAMKGSMRRGRGEGAALYVTFAKNGMTRFLNRSRSPPRAFLVEYGLSSCGIQEHAEQAVINDAIKFAKDHEDIILSANLFIAGLMDGKPYRYSEPTYICMNCASYIKEILPPFSTFVFIPAEIGWYSFSGMDLYSIAVETYMYEGKTGQYRKEKLVIKSESD